MHRELIARYDRPGPRYTSYPTANEFHEGVGEGDLRAALRALPAEGRLSLYVHIPFCEERCLYCACNVIATKRREVAERYLEHLLCEITLAADCLGVPRRGVDQLHLGGGTPTYFTSAQLRRLVDAIRARFDLADEAELAIEIDPRVTSQAQIATLQELGFRRFSMGVQDFDPGVQAAIGSSSAGRPSRLPSRGSCWRWKALWRAALPGGMASGSNSPRRGSSWPATWPCSSTPTCGGAKLRRTASRARSDSPLLRWSYWLGRGAVVSSQTGV